jgi:hypothetical protein
MFASGHDCSLAARTARRLPGLLASSGPVRWLRGLLGGWAECSPAATTARWLRGLLASGHDCSLRVAAG